MLLVVQLHDPYHELPHGRVPDIVQFLRQTFEVPVVLLLEGEETLGLGQDPLSILPQSTESGNRCRFTRELGGRADRLGKVVEKLMVAAFIVENMRAR